MISLAAFYIPDHEAVADFGFEMSLALSNHYALLANSYAYDLWDEPSSKWHIDLSLFYVTKVTLS